MMAVDDSQVTDVEVVQALRESVRLIDTFGWVQNQNGSKLVGFCALGAIDHAVGINWPLYIRTLTAFKRVIGVSSVVRFNDHAKSWGEVRGTFERAIQNLRG